MGAQMFYPINFITRNDTDSYEYIMTCSSEILRVAQHDTQSDSRQYSNYFTLLVIQEKCGIQSTLNSAF